MGMLELFGKLNGQILNMGKSLHLVDMISNLLFGKKLKARRIIRNRLQRDI
jgi:hypothetical protein